MQTGLSQRGGGSRGLGPGAKVADPAEQPEKPVAELSANAPEPLIVTHKSVGSNEDYMSAPHDSDADGGRQDWRNRNYPNELGNQTHISSTPFAPETSANG